ncbi:MAG: phosphoribosylaminoimidazolesuccinocarboxamide synthase [Elusimicrobia bacterium]|nr:phosphoribosylaminoimidazolesuccinocarboxamide synthase [Elusimicrobiota bacterium]
MAHGMTQLGKLDDVTFFKKGKVREIYDLQDMFLMVATDRISCFDVVLPTDIPRKGEVLTKLSVFWFDFLKHIVPNHFITDDVQAFPEALRKYDDMLRGRSILVKKAVPVPVECIVRGYLSGSGWKEYRSSNSICGIQLPGGLRESDKLPEPIFTPSTKAEEGHDVNISQEQAEKLIGKKTADMIRQMSLSIYTEAARYAESKGIIIADTKFEFGEVDGKLILIDEVLTPDSSRFWPRAAYAPGKGQPSFDKQFVRDYLETLDWDKTPPGPKLPEQIVQKTTQKYLQVFAMLTGRDM